MTNEIRRIIQGTTGGVVVGSGIGGMLFTLIGTMMVGLQPMVMLACGVYAGAVYGGIVGAVLGAREAHPEGEATAATVLQRKPGLVLAAAHSHAD